MRRVLTALIVVALLQSATAAPPPANGPWPEVAQRWIKKYRAKPEPMALPAVIRGLSQHGTLKEPESSGLYVGFFAGVLGANPKNAWKIVEKTLPLPFEDQWILIRALAYSGLPEWKDHMRVLAMRLPDRQEMVQRYLAGDLPALSEVALETQKPGTFDKVKSFFSGDMFFKTSTEPKRRQITFEFERGPHRHAVGHLFRDRERGSDRTDCHASAMGEGARQRRKADNRQHGAVHARLERGARRRSAPRAERAAGEPAEGSQAGAEGSDRGGGAFGYGASRQGRDGGARRPEEERPGLDARPSHLGLGR